MKYLIVDDNDDIRKMISRKVCSETDSVVECDDGEMAPAFYADHLPDYVLMDIQMPRIDGLVSTKMILKKFPCAHIIVVTNYDTPAFRRAAFKAGALAFFSKENLGDVKTFICSLNKK